MAEPSTPDTARETVRRLGTFLADLTRDRPAERIHQEILQRLQEPGQEPDGRLAGIYLLAKDFLPVWTGIRTGAALPASSWETVVLPTVVHYSPAQAVKPNLEAATQMWLTARAAVAAPVPEPVGAVSGPGWVDGTIAAPVPAPAAKAVQDATLAALPPVPVEEEGPAASPRRRTVVWITMLAAFALILVAGVALVVGGGGGTQGQATDPGPAASPGHQPSPPAIPSAAASATPTAPTASPPPNGAGGPGAPRGLVSTGHTATTITLSWRPPAPTEGIEVAYYQAFANGRAVGGRIEETGHTLADLAPGTEYRVTVVAFDRRDRPSPPSNAITVRTASTFIVPASVAYGTSFKISGQGFRCGRVTVRLMPAVMPENSRYRIASPAPGSNGSFSVTIVVKRDEHGYAMVQNLDGGQIHLTAKKWQLEVTCGQTSQTAVFEVRPGAEGDDQRES